MRVLAVVSAVLSDGVSSVVAEIVASAVEIMALPSALNLAAGGGPKLSLTRDPESRNVTAQSFPG